VPWRSTISRPQPMRSFACSANPPAIPKSLHPDPHVFRAGHARRRGTAGEKIPPRIRRTPAGRKFGIERKRGSGPPPFTATSSKTIPTFPAFITVSGRSLSTGRAMQAPRTQRRRNSRKRSPSIPATPRRSSSSASSARRKGDWTLRFGTSRRRPNWMLVFSEAYLALGMSLAASGRYAEAKPPLQHYVQLSPTILPVIISLPSPTLTPAIRMEPGVRWALQAQAAARSKIDGHHQGIPFSNDPLPAHATSCRRRNPREATSVLMTSGSQQDPRRFSRRAFCPRLRSRSGLFFSACPRAGRRADATLVRGHSSRAQRHHLDSTPRAFLLKCFSRETVGRRLRFLRLRHDGWMDIYLVNSGPCDFYSLHRSRFAMPSTGTTAMARSPTSPRRRGFRAALTVWALRSAITTATGCRPLRHQYPRSILYHNNGDGTFIRRDRKVWPRSSGGRPAPSGSITTTMDGWTLFVCASPDFSRKKNVWCGGHGRASVYYWQAERLPTVPSWLFHNNGDGTFSDVSRESVLPPPSPKLGLSSRPTSITTGAWTFLSPATQRPIPCS